MPLVQHDSMNAKQGCCLCALKLQGAKLHGCRHYETQMAAEMVPEIRRTSLAAAVLALKALSLDIDVLSFDFLDQPEVCPPPPGCLQG